eukprot:Gb_02936 [translate_table: standard]
MELGPTIVAAFFTPEDGQISWATFLRAYDRCCKKTPASFSINLLIRLFHEVKKRAQIPSNLKFTDEENDDKIGGCFSEKDVHLLLWTCWVMVHNSRLLDLFNNFFDKSTIQLPEVKPLVKSAVAACSGSNETMTLNIEIPAESLFSWILATIPGLAQCFAEYVQDGLQRASMRCEVISNPSKQTDSEVHSSDAEMAAAGLLTSGTAWAIALSLRDSLGGELLTASFMSVSHLVKRPDLIYRSSLHGKGLSRFWSHVEGYHGPLLILVSGSSTQEGADDFHGKRWVVGAVTRQGFENKDSFYGSSGCLYAVSPVFHPFYATGRDKSFVYSHLHAPGRVYEAHPKPVGIAFGGTQGNERVFLDEDFGKITIRHHAVDKTYQPGSLVPGQEYLAVEAMILEVEVWGLGGKAAKQEQAMYKKRELLFTEQRRKVDLKNFAWEDSPEKIMLDLISDPNRVQREER